MSEAFTDTEAVRPTTVGSLVAARRTLSEMARTPDWARVTQLAVQAEQEIAAAENSATASSEPVVPVGTLRLRMVEALGSMKTRRGREAQVLGELTRIQAELEYVIGAARAGAGWVCGAPPRGVAGAGPEGAPPVGNPLPVRAGFRTELADVGRADAMPMYYVSNTVYQPGDVMAAGRFWQDAVVASGLTPEDDPLGEFIREAVRAEHYKDKPSRTCCSMAWLTLEDALFFRSECREGARVYEVEFTDPVAPRHQVTFTAFQTDHPMGLRLQSHEFWNGKMDYGSHLEVFAETGMRVLREMSESEFDPEPAEPSKPGR